MVDLPFVACLAVTLPFVHRFVLACRDLYDLPAKQHAAARKTIVIQLALALLDLPVLACRLVLLLTGYRNARTER